jgi:hypothetical protein
MEFPSMGKGPDKKQIIDALRNTAQSASNMVAENASMPVDALAWALRKVGLPVGDKPVMGSDWMREKGLTAPVQEGASKVVGDTIGMISPMGLSKQGAKAMIDAGSKLKGLPVGMSIKDVSGPQSQALMLAQQRAALPVEQGGLGLAAGNTPAERAAAMGFDDKTWYHGTNADIKKFDPKKSAQGGITWIAENPQYSADYASRAGGNVIPLQANLGKQAGWKEYDNLGIDELAGRGYNSTYLPDGDESVAFVMKPEQLRSRFAAFDPFRKTAATAAAMGVAAPDLLAQERNK